MRLDRSPRVHETDDYLEHGVDEVAPPESEKRSHDALVPLIVGVMVGCIALSVAQVIEQVAPDWNSAYFVVAPVLSALAGYATHRLGHRRFISSTERLRLQLFELAVIFLLLKIASFMDNTLPEIWAEVSRWQNDILLFFDMETLTAFALAAAGWFSGWLTIRDLEAVADPLLYKGETGPMERLNKRFLIGGIVLLFFSGLARFEITTLLDPNRPHVSGLVLNVLVYFVLGLAVLGRVRFTWLQRMWKQQKFKVAGELNGLWLRYSVLFLTVALIIAFILPTQYTVGLLDIARLILSAIGFVIALIVSFFTLLWSLLVSLLFPKSETTMPTPEVFARATPPNPIGGLSEPVPWLLLLRSVLFWVIALGAIFYVVWSYLRDRPDLLKTVKRFRLTQIVRTWWRALASWWRDFRKTVRENLPAISLNFLRRKRARGGTRNARRKGQALREQVFYYYLDILDRARDEGIPRRTTQTPYEYQATLNPNLPEAHDEIASLTQMFVTARYSDHQITGEDVQRLQTTVKHVRDALDRHSERET